MKLGLIALLFSALFLFSTSAFGFAVPNPTGHVTDMAGKLSSSDKATLEAKLRGISETSQNEIAVLILKSLDGDSIEDATHEVFNKWGVGKAGLDNGVLLVIAVADRKTRIQTGKGVEGDLTDLQSKEILDSMRPFLRTNNFNGACNLAVDKINSQLETRKGQKVDKGKGADFKPTATPMPTTTPASGSSRQSCGVGILGTGIGGFGWLLLLGLAAIPIMLIRRYRRLAREEAEREVQRDIDRASAVAASLASFPSNPVVPYVAPAYRETLARRYTPRYESPEPEESVVPTVAAATAAVVAASIFSRGKSYESLDLDDIKGPSYSSEPEEPQGFGGGESGGGGASSDWGDDDDTSSDDSTSDDSGSSDDGSSSDW